MPDPVDADPSSSRSQRTGDITSLLINIYGSKVRDDFWCCGRHTVLRGATCTSFCRNLYLIGIFYDILCSRLMIILLLILVSSTHPSIDRVHTRFVLSIFDTHAHIRSSSSRSIACCSRSDSLHSPTTTSTVKLGVCTW